MKTGLDTDLKHRLVAQALEAVAIIAKPGSGKQDIEHEIAKLERFAQKAIIEQYARDQDKKEEPSEEGSSRPHR